jgi:DNA-binding transcriptional regulator YdaS (Cro superfamily)
MRNRVPDQIERAIAHVGSAAELARRIDVDPDFVRQWRNGSKPVPVRFTAAIELATDRKVTRQELRPDDWQSIWPELSKSKRKAS